MQNENLFFSGGYIGCSAKCDMFQWSMYLCGTSCANCAGRVSVGGFAAGWVIERGAERER